MTKNILHEIRHKSKYFCDQIFIFTVFLCQREKEEKSSNDSQSVLGNCRSQRSFIFVSLSPNGRVSA